MNHYRIYPIDASGRIMGPAAEIHCLTDVEALQVAREMLREGPSAVELWQGPRLVSTWDVPQAATVPTDPDLSARKLPAQSPPQSEVAPGAV